MKAGLVHLIYVLITAVWPSTWHNERMNELENRGRNLFDWKMLTRKECLFLLGRKWKKVFNKSQLMTSFFF